MSLYVFNVTPTTATVTADTRQCSLVNGVPYHLNDAAQKLHIVGDTIITVGGVQWVCNCILNRWKESGDCSAQKLHEATLEILPYINGMGTELGFGHKNFLDNPYLLEFCILQYDSKLGHNVFYHIATSTGYQLERFDVDGIIHPSAQMFGGIDYEIVQDYFGAHKGQVKCDYLNAVHAAYELAVSEKIGGTLMIAMQDRGKITLSQRKLTDRRPLRKAMDLLAPALNICGKNLHIICPDVNGGVNKVSIDEMGFFMYNGRYYMAGDGNSGKIGMDSHWGIFGGPKALFDVTDTGYVKPSFVGADGKIQLDKDGFPVNTNFMLGIDGKSYFRGTVVAEAGRFKGVVQAEDFMLKDGQSMISVLNEKGKIKGDYIDIRGANIVNEAGDRVLYMDETGIHWDAKFSPFKTQYSMSATGPWHETYAANDEYRRDTTDGGITWGPGIKYVAKDGLNGNNGSDASVTFDNILKSLQKAEATKTSFITADAVGSPTIYGAKIYGAEIYAGGANQKGGQIIELTDRGMSVWNGHGNRVLAIHELNGGANLTTGYNPLRLSSPNLSFGDAGYIGFSGQKADFTKVDEVDFTGAKTKGIHSTFL